MQSDLSDSDTLSNESTRSTRTQPNEGGAASAAANRVSHLCDLVQDALRCAIRTAPLGGAMAEGWNDGALSEALRQISRAARESGIRAEQLLVLIKAEWRCMPETQVFPKHDEAAALARVVTVCIREYYRSGADESGRTR